MVLETELKPRTALCGGFHRDSSVEQPFEKNLALIGPLESTPMNQRNVDSREVIMVKFRLPVGYGSQQ